MPKRRTLAVLGKPARKVIRDEAEHLLKKADQAVGRLKSSRDAEALHDARVALRKLRAWFQAFRDELPLKRKRRHALRDLAHSTNDVRDAEVGLEWLAHVDSRMRPKAAHFASDLEAARTAGYRSVREELPSAWHKLSRKLQRTVKGLDAPKSRFRKAFHHSLQGYAHEFERARVQARRKPVPPNIHALRIAGKKLRYLTEAVLKSEPVVRPFIGEMQKLHDSAGSIQDLQRLQALSEQDFLHQADGRYHRLLAVRGKTRRHPDLAPDLEPLLSVGRAAGKEQKERITRFRKAYLGSQQPRCVRELHWLLRRIN